MVVAALGRARVDVGEGEGGEEREGAPPGTSSARVLCLWEGQVYQWGWYVCLRLCCVGRTKASQGVRREHPLYMSAAGHARRRRRRRSSASACFVPRRRHVTGASTVPPHGRPTAACGAASWCPTWNVSGSGRRSLTGGSNTEEIGYQRPTPPRASTAARQRKRPRGRSLSGLSCGVGVWGFRGGVSETRVGLGPCGAVLAVHSRRIRDGKGIFSDLLVGHPTPRGRAAAVEVTPQAVHPNEQVENREVAPHRQRRSCSAACSPSSPGPNTTPFTRHANRQCSAVPLWNWQAKGHPRNCGKELVELTA